MDVINYLLLNLPALVSAVVAVLVALIGLFMLIPGPQPEGFLQKVLDFISKFSKK